MSEMSKNTFSYISDDNGQHKNEKGRKDMARNTRVTTSLFMAAALAAFGGLATTAGAGDKTWIKDGSSGNWTSSGDNWSPQETFTSADSAIFTDTSVARTVVVRDAGIDLVNMTVTGGTDGYTFNGGTLTSTTGKLTINSGAVKFQNTSTTFNEMEVNNSSNVTLTAINLYSMDLNNNSSVTLTQNFDIDNGDIAEHSTLTIGHTTASQTTTHDTVFSGTGTLIKANGSTTVLTSNSDGFGGNVQVNGGTLRLNGGSFGSVSAVTVSSAGTLEVASSALINNLKSSGSGSVKIYNDATAYLLGRSDEGDFTGTISNYSGNGNVQIGRSEGGQAKSYITLTTEQTYTGSTTIDNGELTLRNGSIDKSSGVYLAQSNSALRINNTSTNPSVIQNLEGVDDSDIIFASANDTLRVNATKSNTYRGDTSGNGSLNYDAQSSTYVLTLTGDIYHTGTTTISNGVVSLAGANLGTSGSSGNQANLDLKSGTTLRLTDSNQSHHDIYVSKLTGLGNIETTTETARDQTVYVMGGGDYSGRISGGGNLVVDENTANPNPTLILRNANTYTGATTINNGAKLQLNSGGSIESSSNVTVNNSSYLALNDTSAKIQQLTANAGSFVTLGNNTLTVEDNAYEANTSTVAGTVSGNSIGTSNFVLGSSDSSYTPTLNVTGTGVFENTNVAVNNATMNFAGSKDLVSAGLDMRYGSSVNLSSYSGTEPFQINTYTDYNSTGGEIVLGSTDVRINGLANYVYDNTIDTRFSGNVDGNVRLDVGNGVTVKYAQGVDDNLAGATYVESGIFDLDNKSLGDFIVTDNTGSTGKSGGTFTGSGTVDNLEIARYGTLQNTRTVDGSTPLTVEGDFKLTGGTLDLDIYVSSNDSGASVNVGGGVYLDSGTVDVYTAGNTGFYTLFNGYIAQFDEGDLTTIVNGSSSKSGYVYENTTNTLNILVLSGSGMSQIWTGGSGTTGNIWGSTDVDDKNWSAPNELSSATNYTWMSSNLTGGEAIFKQNGDSSDYTTIAVRGDQNVAQIQVTGVDRTFNEHPDGGSLVLAPTSDTAVIMANGTIATFNVVLDEAVSGTNLNVVGGGTVVLNRANEYSGTTAIYDGTSLKLNNEDAAGSGAISFGDTNGNKLYLGTTYDSKTFDNRITDSAYSSSNQVIVSQGASVTLTNSNNDYHATTVVEDSATLTGQYGLSANSVHQLGSNATLAADGGDQTIGGITGVGNNTLNVARGSLTITDNYNSNSNNFSGKLVGDGTLINRGNELEFTVDNTVLATTGFTGNLSAASGTGLVINSDQDLSLDIAALNSESDGKITINTTKNRIIELNDVASRYDFNGAITVNGGTLVMDRDAESLLSSTKHSTNATLTVAGADAKLDVDSQYSIGHLALDGTNLVVATDDYITRGAGLTVSSLTLNNVTNVMVEPNHLYDDVGGYNTFELQRGARIYVVEATGSVSGSDSNVAITDLNGNSLEGRELNVDIYSGTNNTGARNGVATVTAGSGVETSADSDGHRGIYYEYELSKLNSLANTPNVVIDSTPTGSSSIGTETLTVQLTGDGGYTFQGDRSITVDYASNSAKNNYKGTTVVDFANTASTLTSGYDEAFGSTSLLDIQRGNVDLDNHNQTVGGIQGNEGTNLYLGDTLDSRGLLLIAAGTNTNYTYDGRIRDAGDIRKTGAGIQTFSNPDNSVYGKIDVNGGTLRYAGSVNSYSGSDGDVNVNAGTFTQLGSFVAGDVTVARGSELNGYGTIGQDLTVQTGGTYRVTAHNGTLDVTNVTGNTTFAANSGFEFSTEAMSYLVNNPNDYLNTALLTTGEKLTVSSANDWYNDGVITYDLGILGSVNIEVDDGNLVYQGVEVAHNPKNAIKSAWKKDGVKVGDILDRSNYTTAVYNTVNGVLVDPSDVTSNRVLNARYANALVAGHVNLDNVAVSKKEALSLMNYDSGYTATLPVQAALDHTKNMARGLRNRVEVLRAARTIMADALPGFGAYGFGSVQPTGAYGSLVQNALGVPAAGYLGATYYDPYTGTVQAAPAQMAVPGQQAAAAANPALTYIPNYSSTNVWGGSVNNWKKQDNSDGGITGYTYDSYGVMLGADHIRGPMVMGVALGYSYGKLEDEAGLSSNSKIHAYSAGLYTDYNFESGTNLMFFGGYNWFDNKTNRTVAGYRLNSSDQPVLDTGREKTKYHSQSWYAGLNLSRDYLPTDRLTLTPSIGFEYYDARGQAHNRKLTRNSGVVLRDKVGQVRGRSMTAPVDVAVTYDVIRTWDTKLSLMGNAGYAHEFHNKGPKGSIRWADITNAPTINTYGRKPGRSGWNFGVGGRFQKQCLSVDLKYDFGTGKDTSNHRLAANVGWEF